MLDIGKWSEKGDQFLRSKTGKYGNRAEKRDKIILDRNAQNLSFFQLLMKSCKKNVAKKISLW